MKNLFVLSIIFFSLTSCFVYTRGEDGKPGKDGDSNNQKTAYSQKSADSLRAYKTE
nr:hypothetical protein [uncultured Chryseobacterium sp.]